MKEFISNDKLIKMQNQEKIFSNTSVTNNESFDEDGYLIIKNIWDPNELKRPVPSHRGLVNYYGKNIEDFDYLPEESQVIGSLSTYWYPLYREIHSQIRKKIEKIIGCELYNTYYYDRFYFVNQGLDYHLDRPACEISLTFHISSNTTEPWPIGIKTPYNEDKYVNLNPGDGMLYKGCERPHWRYPLKSKYKKNIKKSNFLSRFKKNKEKDFIDDTYYHQIFFHYVLANGNYVEYAFDRGN